MSTLPDGQLPPSLVAASRDRATGRGFTGRSVRAYPVPSRDDDLEALSAQLAATRALLDAATPQEVAAVVATLVRDLGGGLVPARFAGADATLHLDLSLGLSEPVLPHAEPVSVAAMRLSRVLPPFVEDARQVCERLQGEGRRADEAERDAVTGLLTRRAWMRELSQAGPADAVCLIDLDHFKAVNDTQGHAAGDEVLRAVGTLLRQVFRPDDACGRYGGDELACLSSGAGVQGLVDRMARFRERWQRQRPAGAVGVGVSVGVSLVGEGSPRAALEAADRALYAAKSAGRDRTVVAPQDHGAEGHS